MKEIISAVLIVVSLFAGTHFLKEIHAAIRKAALEKAAQGLPSLTGLTKALRGDGKRKENPKQKERSLHAP